MTNVFEYDDYKDVIRADLKENLLHRAYRREMAAAMGCRQPFFSQVIHSHVHLTPDHAAGLCEFWRLGTEETAYFLDLVLFARAGDPKLKRILQSRLKNLRAARQEPTQRFRDWQKVPAGKELQTYYSSWYFAAIHVLVSNPEFSTDISIANRLRLPLPLVKEALQWLAEAGLIQQRKGKAPGWEMTQQAVYLPSSSPMIEAHHGHWMRKAGESIQRHDSQSLHYSSVFTVSEDDFHRLKQTLVDLLESMSGVIQASPSQRLAAFTCSLFEV